MYQPLIPLEHQDNSNQSIEHSPEHIGAFDKVRRGDQESAYQMAQRLAKITGKPLEYCLNEFGYTMGQQQS